MSTCGVSVRIRPNSTLREQWARLRQAGSAVVRLRTPWKSTVALSTEWDLDEYVKRVVVAKARQEHQYRILAQPMPRAGHRHLDTLLYNHTFASNCSPSLVPRLPGPTLLLFQPSFPVSTATFVSCAFPLLFFFTKHTVQVAYITTLFSEVESPPSPDKHT